MKKVILIICLLCNVIGIYANNTERELKVKKSGKILSVIDFKEGDKIKLFEYKTNEIVLVKTTGEIDFSQLAEGEYVLVDKENNKVMINYEKGRIIINEMI